MKSLIISITILINAGCSSKSDSSIEHLNSGKILPDNLPFSEAVRVDNMLYLSGQIGIFLER